MSKVERPVFNFDAVCQLCRNRMIDLCVEDCSQAGDYHWFELGRIEFFNLPAFPTPEEFMRMNPKGRGILVAAYLGKMMDFLQGKVQDDLPRLPTFNNKRSLRVPNFIPVNALFDGAEKGNPPHPPVGKTDSNSGGGSQKLAGEEGG